MGMEQLKKALMDAGLVSEKDVQRDRVKRQHMKKGGKMRRDQIRIVCEACEKSAPDVERYQHKNRLISGKEWLCIPCADEYQIDDECRLTHQSTQARQGMFTRRYGRTKRF